MSESKFLIANYMCNYYSYSISVILINTYLWLLLLFFMAKANDYFPLQAFFHVMLIFLPLIIINFFFIVICIFSRSNLEWLIIIFSLFIIFLSYSFVSKNQSRKEVQFSVPCFSKWVWCILCHLIT